MVAHRQSDPAVWQSVDTPRNSPVLRNSVVLKMPPPEPGQPSSVYRLDMTRTNEWCGSMLLQMNPEPVLQEPYGWPPELLLAVVADRLAVTGPPAALAAVREAIRQITQPAPV